MHVEAIDIDGMLDWLAAHVTGADSREVAYWAASRVLRYEFDGTVMDAAGDDGRMNDVPRFTAEVVKTDDICQFYFELALVPTEEHDGFMFHGLVNLVEDYLLKVRLPETRTTPTYFSSDTL
jgi:hypothetical protein